jgi:endonuclease G, mitochondrial
MNRKYLYCFSVVQSIAAFLAFAASCAALDFTGFDRANDAGIYEVRAGGDAENGSDASDPADSLVMGNPSRAAADVNTPNNYLMIKPQYSLSYNRDKGTPNWVAWHLDASWIGSTTRQDDYRPDTALPAGWYQVQATDYFGSGFDRGHMCPSGDRTNTVADNSATFLMTNFIPQAPDNNQGPWEVLESYCRSLVSQGNELYIVDGPWGIGGVGSNGGVTNSVASGNVTVPAKTWKVILVLPTGTNDVNRVTKNTRTIAVIMPNVQGIFSVNWQNYRVSVHQVEALTGYNFFSNVRPIVRNIIKQRTDRM